MLTTDAERPVPLEQTHFAIRIAKYELDKLVRDGIGELWIKSPAMMNGYLDAPDETNEVISNGWFKTGDLATVDEGGVVTRFEQFTDTHEWRRAVGGG